MARQSCLLWTLCQVVPTYYMNTGQPGRVADATAMLPITINVCRHGSHVKHRQQCWRMCMTRST